MGESEALRYGGVQIARMDATHRLSGIAMLMLGAFRQNTRKEGEGC